MKRISFANTPPRSKNKHRTTAFWTAIFLLLFANLFAFALAEDFPDDPNGETTVADEAGEGDGTDESGEPAEPGEESGGPDENGEPAEPGEGEADDEAGAVSRLSEEVMLLAADISVNDETGLRDAVNAAPADDTPYVIEITGTPSLTADLLIRDRRNITLTGDGTLTQENSAQIQIERGGTLTLDDALVIAGDGNGSAVINNRGTFNMHGGTITDGNGVRNSGRFDMSGGTISENRAGDGGGVHNTSNATFTMTGGEISYNHATGEGGGVFNDYGSMFTMRGGTISDNRATTGGGVFNGGDVARPEDPLSTFTMENGEISDNRATTGGGVANDYGGIFVMRGGTISENGADAGGGVFNGGDVSRPDAPYSTFTMEDGEISGNSAGHGAGVYNIGRFRTEGGTISIGGGTGVENHGDFSMADGTISIVNLSYGYDCGVLNNAGGDFTMEGGTIRNTGTRNSSDGVKNLTGGTFAMEGGVIADCGSGVTNAGGDFTMKGGTISGRNGVQNTGVFTMSGGEILTDDNWGVLNDADGRFTMTGGAIRGGPDRSGGGVYNDEYATFTMDEGTIADVGGGVINNGDFTMNGGIIRNCEYSGVGTGEDWEGTFTMNGGMITDCGWYGVNSGATFRMTGGTIQNCTGSGVRSYSPESRFDMSGGTIRNNVADWGGGGVLNEAPFTMTGGLITGNTATGDEWGGGDGGGVYNGDSGTFIMSGGTISGNTAAGRGGGVCNDDYVYGPASPHNLFTMTGGAIISSNTAVTGGGVYNADRLCMAGGLITGNTATVGGGLYPDSGENSRLRFGFDFDGNDLGSAVTRIERNTADLGGGLYLPDGSGYEGRHNDSVLIGYNTARNGGGVYFPADGVLDGILRIEGNHAIATSGSGGLGGGVYAAGNLDISGTVVSGNDARFGGGLYLTGYGKLFGGAGFQSGGDLKVALSGNRATTGTFLPPGGDAVWGLSYAGLYGVGGGFLSYSRPELGTAFTNDDINYIGSMTVTYQDSAGRAAGGMPSPSTLTAAENEPAGDVFHRVAAGPAGLGNFVFKGWKLVGNALAFLDGDTDTITALSGETAEITFAPDDLIRPLVNIVLDAIWGTNNTGGGGGGRPPGGDEGGGGDDEGDGGDGGDDDDPEPPGPEPPGPVPPTPTPNPPTTGTNPARPAAPAATVVANVLPDLPAPAPQPEPVLTAEAVTPPAPPAETPAPRVNAFEDFLATTGIAPLGIPLAAPDGSAWAILNLILALLSVVCAALAILRFRQANTRAAGLNAAYADDARARRPDFTYTILAAALALVSVVAFFLTENVSLRAAWLDRFSPFMLALFVLCAVLFALAVRTRPGEAQSRAVGESQARIPREQA